MSPKSNTVWPSGMMMCATMYVQFRNCPRSQRLSPVLCSQASRKCTSQVAEKIQYSMPS
jgi:hypothetical protein